jgi:hypothetical protein
VRRFTVFLLLSLFLSPLLRAQEIVPERPARHLTRFGFRQFSGGIILVRATVGQNKDSFNFILDTGSGGISLDSSTCSENLIITHPSDTSITGIAGSKKVSYVFNETLHFPGLAVTGLNFHVTDYSLLSSSYGEKIDGIIGYSFFSRYLIKINFDSLVMDIYEPGRFKYPSGSQTLRPLFTSLPVQHLTIKDKRKVSANFYLDTGAGLCFLLSDQFTSDSALLNRRRKPILTQAEGMGGKKQMRLTVVKEVRIGGYRFRNVPTYLYKDVYNVTAYPFTGGLAGNDLLRRFNLIINYPEREINILPNTHFDDPFEYGYSGMSLYMIEGKIIVEDIIPRSPADEAGLKSGDEIVAVNNNFSGQIQTYKNMLLEPEKRIPVLIKRNEELLTLTLYTLSIL